MHSINKITNFDVIIVGGGPSGLICAHFCALNGKKVAIVEAKNRVGRKFLVAGDGGLNLSNNLNLETFVSHYSTEYVKQCVRNFNPTDLRNWLKGIGIETYIGSSGKIFPLKGIKPAQVLDAIINSLEKLKVQLFNNHTLRDFDNNSIFLTNNEDGKVKLSFKKLVLALGGASWSKTGSTGEWKELFQAKGIETKQFKASNAGMNVAWKPEIASIFGSVIQNVNIFLGKSQKFGNLTITNYGVEGTVIYWLNRSFREENNRKLLIDFLPNFNEQQIEKVLLKKGGNIKELLKLNFKVKKPVLALLNIYLSKGEFLDPQFLAKTIKNFPIQIESLRPIDEAISSVGGVSNNAITSNASLVNYENIFISGEMLDWDAPTGGFLLQACFSMGVEVAKEINKVEIIKPK
jgi:uncharacterized flavoprotein (TIGR03862 family)